MGLRNTKLKTGPLITGEGEPAEIVPARTMVTAKIKQEHRFKKEGHGGLKLLA